MDRKSRKNKTFEVENSSTSQENVLFFNDSFNMHRRSPSRFEEDTFSFGDGKIGLPSEESSEGESTPTNEAQCWSNPRKNNLVRPPISKKFHSRVVSPKNE